MIKTVILEQKIYTQRIPYDVGYTKRTTFTKYIAENGGAVCAVNGEIVEPNAGNETYRGLKAKGAVCVEREVTNESDAEIIDRIESGIDRHAAYIDNYNQYAEVRERNDRLYKLLTEFKDIAKK